MSVWAKKHTQTQNQLDQNLLGSLFYYNLKFEISYPSQTIQKTYKAVLYDCKLQMKARMKA